MLLDMIIGMVLGMAASPLMMKGVRLMRQRMRISKLLREISELKENDQLDYNKCQKL